MDTGSPSGVASEYVERARRLVPGIEACADQIEQERRLAVPVLDALFEAGMFRLLLPRSLDGGEIDPATLRARSIGGSVTSMR
jgi:indole-3-acetate monooxygenase